MKTFLFILFSFLCIVPSNASSTRQNLSVNYDNGDVFEYQSGENVLFCRVDKICNDTSGKVTIIRSPKSSGSAEDSDNAQAEREPNGKLVIPSVLTMQNGDEYEVVALERSAFASCTGITEVEINCKEIAPNAFFNCKNLQKVVFGDNVESLGSAAFAKSAITSVNLNRIRKIQYDSMQPFCLCEGLREIIVPEYNDSFVSVDNVLYSEDMQNLIVFPSSVDISLWSGFHPNLVKVAPWAFINLQAKSLRIPASLGNIKNSYQYAFCNSKIDTLYVDGAYVSKGAFMNSVIKQIAIDYNVKWMGGECFLITGLEDLYLYGIDLPELEYSSLEEAFCFSDIDKAILHVLPGFDLPAKITADIHKWSYFVNVVEDITAVPTQIQTVNMTSSTTASPAYNLSGQRVGNDYHGLMIRDGKKIWNK